VNAGAAPRSASERGYLRGGLPGVYREGEFGMSFVQALEEVLDPVVCLLDTLPEHIDPELAPEDMINLIAAWLGLETEDAPASQRREMVRRAPELSRLRGTRAGLELTLRLTFPDLPLHVYDLGGVSWSAEHEVPPAPAPAIEVASDVELDADRRADVERVVARAKPAQVAHRIVGPGEQRS
jgi:phage tail-like protein